MFEDQVCTRTKNYLVSIGNVFFFWSTAIYNAESINLCLDPFCMWNNEFVSQTIRKKRIIIFDIRFRYLVWFLFEFFHTSWGVFVSQTSRATTSSCAGMSISVSHQLLFFDISVAVVFVVVVVFTVVVSLFLLVCGPYSRWIIHKGSNNLR